MTTKQIDSLSEAPFQSFRSTSRPQALRKWAEFLAPKEVSPARVLKSRDPAVWDCTRIRTWTVESAIWQMTLPLYTEVPATAKGPVDDEIEALIAWSLRDENFDPAANERIERSWDV